jgi:hypothetical protein
LIPSDWLKSWWCCPDRIVIKLLFSSSPKLQLNKLQQGSLIEGELSTADLLALNCLDPLLFIKKIIFTFYKTSYLTEEVNCTKSASVCVPWLVFSGGLNIAQVS